MNESHFAEAFRQTRLIEVEGTFTQSAAARMQQAAQGDATSEPFTIDFSRSRGLDGALALLAVTLIGLHRQGRRVRVLGLPDQARSSLLHFGISVGASGDADFRLREEVPFSD